MPMYQNFHFSVKMSLEDTVKAVEKIMNKMQWRIVHEFDKFDMSVDYVRQRQRSLFGRGSAEGQHIDMSVTLRYKEAGDKIIVYLLSSEAIGDAIAAATRPQDPAKKKILMDTNSALLDALRP